MHSDLPNWPLSRPSASAERNLILVHTKGFQSISDFEAIRDFVTQSSPDIEVFLVDNELSASGLRRKAARRPTLLFSPVALMNFRPERGKIYEGRAMAKIKQVERLQAAGLPVPKTALLAPGTKFDPREWGEYVVLKPSLPAFQSKGQAVILMCTEDVRFIPPEDYPAEHPGRYSPMIVQSYVHAEPALSNIRVLTIFGEPLYALQSSSKLKSVELTPGNVRQNMLAVAHQSIPPSQKSVHFVYDEAVLALARAAYAACPEAALQGCDILRDSRTGRLCILEFNPGGNTWHFSSARAEVLREVVAPEDRLGQKRKSQFDAFRTAARVLAKHTRLEAL